LTSKIRRFKKSRVKGIKGKTIRSNSQPKRILNSISLAKQVKFNLLRRVRKQSDLLSLKLNPSTINNVKLRPVYDLFCQSSDNLNAHNVIALKLKNLYNFKLRKFRRFYRFKSLKVLKKSNYKNLVSHNNHLSLRLSSTSSKLALNAYMPGKLTGSSFALPSSSLKTENIIKSFRLSYLSLFLKFRLLATNFSFNSEKFLIRKTLFSFLKSNEVKKSIMRRRRKIKVFRLYRKLSTSELYNYNIDLSSTSYSSLLHDYTSHDKPHTPLSSKIEGKRPYELFLPRVKFKPGYQRL
jgi:hypothetical protein